MDDKATRLRRAMVADQLRAGGVRDEAVLSAMGRVPRHQYVPGVSLEEAYADRALPTAQNQTISQPLIVAKMTELLAVGEGMTVLEVGLGSGYQAAVLKMMGADVVGIERFDGLAQQAEAALADAEASGTSGGPGSVRVVTGDGTQGYAEGGPYDRIIVTAGAPSLPPALRDQLADPGRIVIPIGDRAGQRLTVFELTEGKWTEQAGLPCRFVPLVGEAGWGAG